MCSRLFILPLDYRQRNIYGVRTQLFVDITAGVKSTKGLLVNFNQIRVNFYSFLLQNFQSSGFHYKTKKFIRQNKNFSVRKIFNGVSDYFVSISGGGNKITHRFQADIAVNVSYQQTVRVLFFPIFNPRVVCAGN